MSKTKTTSGRRTARRDAAPGAASREASEAPDEAADEASDEAEPKDDVEAEGGEGADFGDADPEAGDVELVKADAIEPPRGRGALTPSRNQLERFLAEVRRYPRLSDEEERALGKAVREQGDREAARKLVVHNLRLVVSMAYQYRRAWANILDLFQEGSVGLMEAVKRWEPTLGPRFGTYAAYWIRAYVLRFLMTNSRLISVANTRAGRKLFFRLEKERQRLIATGFEPTPKLLAAKLDVDEQDLAEVSQILDGREVSIDPTSPRDHGSGEGVPLSEKIAGGGESPEAAAEGAELAGAVRRFMTEFAASLEDEREATIWREHLAADEPAPLGDLGARYGVSKQRMGQIADRLKKRFKEQIVRELGPDVQTAWR
jgi:RNA polymerase sigma-32 factor